MENITYLTIFLVFSAVTFLGYTAYAVYVLIKVKFAVENGSMVTIGMYFFCLGMKFIFWLLEVLQNYDRNSAATYIPDTIGTYLIIGVYFYFIFEVKMVRLKLESENVSTFRESMINLRVFYLIMYLIIAGRCIIDCATYF